MKNALVWISAAALLVLGALGLYAKAAEAHVLGDAARTILAARPSVGDAVLLTQLNGEVTKLGTLETTGTSVNNTTTATTFTVTTADCASRIVMYDCDTAGLSIGNGATCSDTITNANYKPTTLTAHEWRYFILDSTGATTTICLDSAAVTAKCAVFCVR